MAEELFCDICGRSAAELPASTRDGDPYLETDQDGLWVCRDCSGKLVTAPVGATFDGELIDEIRGLVGKSAGAICSTLNLPYEPPYRSIIDAASKIAYDEDRYMSAWAFATQWSDGTTVWRDPDGDAIAFVPPEGEIQIESG